MIECITNILHWVAVTRTTRTTRTTRCIRATIPEAIPTLTLTLTTSVRAR